MITSDWLKLIGIYPFEDALPRVEHAVRIHGGTDENHIKHDSNDDEPDDEVVELVIELRPGGAYCYLETHVADTFETLAIIELGRRETQREVLDLCWSLKAWAIRYPLWYDKKG